MSLKRKLEFDQFETSSTATSLCTEDELTAVKYIKTEQLLDRTSSDNIFYNNNTNNSPSNDHNERKSIL